MKPELEKLLISEIQFQEITGISITEVNEIIIDREKKFLHKLRKIALDFFMAISIYIIGISVVLALIIWLFAQIFRLELQPESANFFSALKLAAYFSIPIGSSIAIKLNYGKLAKLNAKKNNLKHLAVLFNEFQKHNQIVRAIDVKEQLDAVEQTESDPQIKLTLLKALIEMREDLIKALKVEKILRENSSVVQTNPELFQSSFNATNVQKIIDRGSEYDRLINKTLKIGTKVNQEIKLMQNDNSVPHK
ncbi:MAG: hypothetical protein ACFBSE_19075 [Prochloraceae cyanobacterium]